MGLILILNNNYLHTSRESISFHQHPAYVSNATFYKDVFLLKNNKILN